MDFGKQKLIFVQCLIKKQFLIMVVKFVAHEEHVGFVDLNN